MISLWIVLIVFYLLIINYCFYYYFDKDELNFVKGDFYEIIVADLSS